MGVGADFVIKHIYRHSYFSECNDVLLMNAHSVKWYNPIAEINLVNILFQMFFHNI